MRSFFWSVFFLIWTEFGKYDPEKALYLDFVNTSEFWEKGYWG